MSPAEDCNRRLANVQQGVEELTREWMAWAAGGLPNSLAPTDRQALANLRAGIQNWGADRFSKELRQHFPLVMRAFPSGRCQILQLVARCHSRQQCSIFWSLMRQASATSLRLCHCLSEASARSLRATRCNSGTSTKWKPAFISTLLEQHGLKDHPVQRFTYQVNSAFDLANANSSVPDAARVGLDLHFRSHELIADYCNEAFYAKTLHVGTVTERLNIPRGVAAGNPLDTRSLAN